MLKRAGLWLRTNLQRRRYEREMRDEMTEHLDRATRLLMHRGVPADEAARQARREFGDVAYHQTKARDARGTLWLDDLKADSRFALRHFARKPGTTLLMLIVLAFGMSISTLLFSLVHGLSVLPPPAVRLEDDLVRIRGSRLTSSTFDPLAERRFEDDEFLAYRNLTSHFTAIAGWVDQTGVLQVPKDAQRIGYSADLIFVTENYFRVLDIQPMLGAGLPTVTREDPAANAVGVIDYDTWRDRFGQRRDVLGSVVTINGVAITIVGVAPNRFRGANTHMGVQVWLPLAARHLVLTTGGGFNAVARLRPGVTREAANSAVQTIAARVDTIAGETIIREPGTEVVPLLAANSSPEFDGDIRKMALMLGLLGALVLVVTCTNVSALLTGLASARRREIAVRLSLGAPRSRIIRQLLTESAVLAVFAGAAALAIVAVILRVAVALVPDIPLELKIEWPTTTFTFAIALGVGVLFGLSPALHATRLALASVLRDSSGGIASSRARLQRSLVVAQIAFTQPLIVLMTTMLVLLTSDMKPVTESDSADRVITLRVETPSRLNWDFTPEMERKQHELMLRLRDQLRATPGVESAVIDWPQVYSPGVYTAHPDDKAGGRSDAAASLAVRHLEGTHFGVLGIPIKSGRTFGPADFTAATPSEAPVIIGEDLASHLWGAANAVGRRLQTMSDSAGSASSGARGPRTLLVVGVVDDPVARTRVAGEPYRVYLPADTARSAEYILIRAAGPAAPLLPTIRGLAQNAAATAIITAQTLANIEEQQNRDRRRVSGAFSAGGIAALLLSAIGLYAVIAFAVTQRTQEIAVRLAVGANRNQITYAFVREGLRLGAFGLVLGLPAGMFAMRQLVATFGMGQMPVAPIILIASTGIFLVAAASAWGPARRAAGVDPATALRRG